MSTNYQELRKSELWRKLHVTPDTFIYIHITITANLIFLYVLAFYTAS